MYNNIYKINNYYVSGAEDYKHNVDDQLLCEVEDLYQEEVVMVSPEYKILADTILAHYCLRPPDNIEEAFYIYSVLTEAVP